MEKTERHVFVRSHLSSDGLTSVSVTLPGSVIRCWCGKSKDDPVHAVHVVKVQGTATPTKTG